jgi:hypothetical protein
VLIGGAGGLGRSDLVGYVRWFDGMLFRGTRGGVCGQSGAERRFEVGQLLPLERELLVVGYESSAGLRQFAEHRLADRLRLTARDIELFADSFAFAPQRVGLFCQRASGVGRQSLNLVAQFVGQFFGGGIRGVQSLLRSLESRDLALKVVASRIQLALPLVDQDSQRVQIV